MKDPYGNLFSALCWIFLDMKLFGLPDILPDFIGYMFFAYGIYLLPTSHQLKRWTKNFAIVLIVFSFFVELDQWIGTELLGQIGVQLMQFLLILFMYFLFQLLLHIHENKALEAKTFKTYQIYMGLMLCAFVIQAFAINVDVSMQDKVLTISAILQVIAFLNFNFYCRSGTKYFKSKQQGNVQSQSL